MSFPTSLVDAIPAVSTIIGIPECAVAGHFWPDIDETRQPRYLRRFRQRVGTYPFDETRGGAPKPAAAPLFQRCLII